MEFFNAANAIQSGKDINTVSAYKAFSISHYFYGLDNFNDVFKKIGFLKKKYS